MDKVVLVAIVLASQISENIKVKKTIKEIRNILDYYRKSIIIANMTSSCADIFGIGTAWCSLCLLYSEY